MNLKQRKSVPWTMFGNQRKKLQKLGQISPRFSREMGDTLRSTFKYFLRFQNTSKFVKNARFRLAVSNSSWCLEIGGSPSTRI